MNFKKKLLLTSRLTKQIIVGLVDFLSICVASFLALHVSSLSFNDLHFEELLRFIWTPFFSIIVFSFTGVYRSIVRYIDFTVIYLLIKAIFLTLTLNLIIKLIYFYIFVLFLPSSLSSSISVVTYEGWLMGLLMSLTLIIGARVWAHSFFSERGSEKKVVIYGAGSAGIQLAGALRVSSEMQPVAFLDNNPSLHNTFLGGIKVLHPKKLERLVTRNKVDEVLIAMPSSSKSALRSLLREIEQYSIKVRILPCLTLNNLLLLLHKQRGQT